MKDREALELNRKMSETAEKLFEYCKSQSKCYECIFNRRNEEMGYNECISALHLKITPNKYLNELEKKYEKRNNNEQ